MPAAPKHSMFLQTQTYGMFCSVCTDISFIHLLSRTKVMAFLIRNFNGEKTMHVYIERARPDAFQAQ